MQETSNHCRFIIGPLLEGIQFPFFPILQDLLLEATKTASQNDMSLSLGAKMHCRSAEYPEKCSVPVHNLR